MKKINTYILEKFRISKDIKMQEYKYHPKSKKELTDLINKLYDERGDEADLNDIDVSNINDMNGLFENEKYNNMNFDISSWDVSNVLNMNDMFDSCKKFNCDISRWVVSKVRFMNYMFYDCKTFNQDLSNWDVSKVSRWNGFDVGSALEKKYHPKFTWNNVK